MFILVNSTDHVERITVQNKPASVLSSAITVTVSSPPNCCCCPYQGYIIVFIFTFYRTNISDMILYRLYTHHLNKDSSDYFTYTGGRAVEGRGKTSQQRQALENKHIKWMENKTSPSKISFGSLLLSISVSVRQKLKGFIPKWNRHQLENEINI